MKDKYVEMLVGVVSIVDFDTLVGIMEESLEKYKINPTKKNRKAFVFDAAMLGLKEVLNKEGVDNLLQQLDLYSGFIDPLIKNKN